MEQRPGRRDHRPACTSPGSTICRRLSRISTRPPRPARSAASRWPAPTALRCARQAGSTRQRSPPAQRASRPATFTCPNGARRKLDFASTATGWRSSTATQAHAACPPISARPTPSAAREPATGAAYPSGWLTAALDEIDREPQVQALCWFVDESLGEIWNDFSLKQHPGQLHGYGTRSSSGCCSANWTR